MFVNYLMFAYDLYVLGLSISGLQQRLNICCDYAAEQKIFLIVTRQSA